MTYLEIATTPVDVSTARCRADNPDLRTVELRRDPEFPGSRVRLALDQIGALYTSWIQVLRNARHLRGGPPQGRRTICRIGRRPDRAFGISGCYQAGHGRNVATRKLAADASESSVNALEVAGSSATVEDVYLRQSLWKTKLATRGAV